MFPPFGQRTWKSSINAAKKFTLKKKEEVDGQQHAPAAKRRDVGGAAERPDVRAIFGARGASLQLIDHVGDIEDLDRPRQARGGR